MIRISLMSTAELLAQLRGPNISVAPRNPPVTPGGHQRPTRITGRRETMPASGAGHRTPAGTTSSIATAASSHRYRFGRLSAGRGAPPIPTSKKPRRASSSTVGDALWLVAGASALVSPREQPHPRPLSSCPVRDGSSSSRGVSRAPPLPREALLFAVREEGQPRRQASAARDPRW